MSTSQWNYSMVSLEVRYRVRRVKRSSCKLAWFFLMVKWPLGGNQLAHSPLAATARMPWRQSHAERRASAQIAAGFKCWELP